jgi:hypothetical protein
LLAVDDEVKKGERSEAGMEYIWYLLSGWAISGIVGYFIGTTKGCPVWGLFMGSFFGPIGWVVLAIVNWNPKCPSCGGSVEQGFPKCRHCGSVLAPSGSSFKSLGPVSMKDRLASKRKS